MNRTLVSVCLSIATTLVFAQSSSCLEEKIASLVQQKQATVGVAVVFDGRDTVSFNKSVHFPMMSVFKFHQALAVLDHLDKRQLPLTTPIFVSKSALLPNTYSPLRDARPEGNFNLSVAELLKYSVSQSDNNACDILFTYLGGPEVVQKYISSLGLRNFSITATEAQMHEGFDKQYLNWITPLDAVRLVEIFRKKGLYTDAIYQNFLEDTMTATITGANKLKALLPPTLAVAHKTGSSDRNAAGLKAGDNDLGFVTLPDGRQYSIVVFVMNSIEDDLTNAAIIAEISKIVYNYYTQK